MKHHHLPFIILYAAFQSLSLEAASSKILEDKVRLLEEKTAQLEISLNQKDRPGRVATFLAENIALGGFFEHAITGHFSEDHSYKLSANSNLFGLNLGVKMNEKFHLVSQELFVLSFTSLNEHNADARAFSNAPAAGAIVAHAYGEYFSSEKFRIQMGLGWSPFGIVLANREFPLYLRRNGPQLSGAGLPEPYALWTGIHMLGQFDTEIGSIGYNLYSITPTSNANRMGGGSRLWWSDLSGKIKIGVSSQTVERGSDTVCNLGGDIDVRFGRFGLRTEYAQSLGNGEDLRTAYAEPYVTFAQGKWIVHGEVDYAKRPLHASETPSSTVSPFERLQVGAGVNWLPWPFLKTRLLFLFNNYINSYSFSSGGRTNDFYTVEYSTGIEF